MGKSVSERVRRKKVLDQHAPMFLVCADRYPRKQDLIALSSIRYTLSGTLFEYNITAIGGHNLNLFAVIHFDRRTTL